MKKINFLFIFILITFFLLIDGLTGRWLPKSLEHISAGFFIPYWLHIIITKISKNKSKKIALLSANLYSLGILCWEKIINLDFLYGFLGILVFLLFILTINTYKSKNSLDYKNKIFYIKK